MKRNAQVECLADRADRAEVATILRTMNSTQIADSQSQAEHRKQAERREQVQRRHRAHCFGFYDEAGNFILHQGEERRGLLWHALSFFNGDDGDVEKANAMLRRSLEKSGDHFWNSATTSLLARFGKKLDADLRDQMQTHLARNFHEEAKQRFRGYNDNYPAMAALTILVGAPLVNEDKFERDGLECLDSLQRLLNRRGLLSEYSSPTYTPITLTCLAEIVELSPIEEARELARETEEKIWWDLLAHFHKKTSSICGPHSRSYTIDLCAHLHNAHAVLYQVLGEEVFINPLKNLPPLEKQVLHNGGAEFIWSHVAWQTTPTYHVPIEAAQLALSEKFPRIVQASSEQAAFPRGFWKQARGTSTPLAEFAAGAMNTYSFLENDYCIGTSDVPFLDGYQHCAFHVAYARNQSKTLPGVSTLFSRFVIDDKNPTRQKHILEEGRALCVQEKNAAMVLYRAKPQWGTPSLVPDYAQTPIASLKLSLMITCFWNQPEEIWIGPNQFETWRGQSTLPCPVFIRDAHLFIAIHPLIQSNFGRENAIRLEEHNGFGIVSLVNYQGQPRTFSDIELSECQNGFVIEVASAKEYFGGFAAFRDFHSNPKIRDQYFEGDGMRLVRYTREGLELEMEISPVSDGIKSRSINGEAVQIPKFRVSGEEQLTVS